MDDFPFFFTEDEDEAMSIAEYQGCDVPARIQSIFGIDATELVCTKIILFVNGEPIGVRVVKDFTN
jgi:hypothetical protein